MACVYELNIRCTEGILQDFLLFPIISHYASARYSLSSSEFGHVQLS
ncbi:hypothetical protein HMPREF3214_00542 [Alloscardovia omnicolens]|nr:hypothetical protein HMPREF3214_00542 [Alloscardovia omnicolens]